MSLLSNVQLNFQSANVGTCTSLRCAKLSAGQVTLADPLTFTENGVRVGTNAGIVNQGDNAIAIGDNAAPLNQPSHSTVINATGAPLDALAPSSLYIAPIRSANGTNVLFYNSTTKEVTRATAGVSQTISIPDRNGVIHNLTFAAGVLVQYTLIA